MYKIENHELFRKNIRNKLVERMRDTKFPNALLKNTALNLESIEIHNMPLLHLHKVMYC